MVIDRGFWNGRKVLVTGHTGFKGAWLSLWLTDLGAKVCGLSLAPVGAVNLYTLTGMDGRVASTIADINDRGALEEIMTREQPEVVFHLAAQAIVRASYADPVATFSANVGGVVTLLDVVRRSASVKAVLVVTSDKCYDNREWVWGYRESDSLGGRDPYSASKGCAEIAARSMQMSYFRPFTPDGHGARIATIRAGNVIGGGDWSQDRLVPDIIRGCIEGTGEVHIRNPAAIRPWQHVLDPLAAYLVLSQQLAEGVDGVDEAWNIGPDAADNRAVADVAAALIAGLGTGRMVSGNVPKGPHEAHLLALDCSKAKIKLGWRPRLNFDQCIALTAEWYSAWHQGHDMAAVSLEQIALFEGCAAPAAHTLEPDRRIA